jgi:hypothetical protein
MDPTPGGSPVCGAFEQGQKTSMTVDMVKLASTGAPVIEQQVVKLAVAELRGDDGVPAPPPSGIGLDEVQ